MDPRTIHHRRPVATLATAAFGIALVVTVAFFAGLVPGVAETLPLFATLVTVTALAFVVAVLAWVLSFVADGTSAAD